MPFFDAIRIGASGAVDTAFSIDRSLRFDSNDNHKLTKTFGTNSSNTTKTISFWVKRGELYSHQSIFTTTSSGYIEGRIDFTSDNRLQITDRDAGSGSSDIQKITHRFFRDPSAWYHIVVAYDTTNSTADDRVKLYINGVQETDFSGGTNNNPASSYAVSFFRSSVDNFIAANNTSSYFDGYLTEINFIDGQALTPSSFGETDSTTGQWVPIDTSELTFGNNGFRLNFSDNSSTTASTLGKDTSGNGNNFTPSNFGATLVDSFLDTPSLNYPVLNPLDSGGDARSYQVVNNGNLQVKAQSSVWASTRATFHVKTGKWYWEVKILSAASLRPFIGIIESNVRLASNQTEQANELGATSTGIAYWGLDRIRGGANTSGVTTNVPTLAANDIVGVALDMDNKKVFFSKNGTFFASQDPANSTGELVAFSTSMQNATIAPVIQSYNNADEGAFNFGQQALAYTPPTGYKELNSANLPTPTIQQSNKHFEAKLYTPNSGNLSVTGFEFQPDWLWLKSRTQAYRHYLFDSVRGAGQKALSTNRQDGEGSDAGSLTSFDSGGFTTSGASGFNDNGSGSNGAMSLAWNAGDSDGKTYAVTVVSDSGNKYRFDGFGTSAVTLDLAEGGTYVFDWSDSSAQSHPIRFSTTSDGTHGGGSEYTTGVVKDDSAYKTTITVAASAPTLYYYCQYHSGMGGQVNTNSTLGSSNFDGSIQSTVKANPTAGFSIVGYTGTNGTGTIGHGLGVTPQAYLVKRRDNASDWRIYHQAMGNTKAMKLNDNGGPATNSSYWNNTSPTSTTVSLGNDTDLNGSTDKYIAYIFSDVEGFSKFGTYTGQTRNQTSTHGEGDGTFVFTGFRPAFIIIKKLASEFAPMFDSARDPVNVCEQRLFPAYNYAESVEGVVDFVSNGFKARNGGGQSIISGNGSEYIYFAFAEAPFKNARAR